MLQGTIKWFNAKGGFGFVVLDCSLEEVHFKKSIVKESRDCVRLKKGVKVNVVLEEEMLPSWNLKEVKEIEILGRESELKEEVSNFDDVELVFTDSNSDLHQIQFAVNKLVGFSSERAFVRKTVFEMLQKLIRNHVMALSQENILQQKKIEFLRELIFCKFAEIQLDLSSHQFESLKKLFDELDAAGCFPNIELKEKAACNTIDFESIINHRSGSISLVLDCISNLANRAALLRTAEALGIQYIFIINPEKYKTRSKGVQNRVSRRAQKFLCLQSFGSASECIEFLKKDNWTIWTTELHRERSSPLELPSKFPCPEKLAVVLGSEGYGVSPAISRCADRWVYLPMFGCTESLNVSVAGALVIQRLFDMFPHKRGDLANEEKRKLISKWKHELS